MELDQRSFAGGINSLDADTALKEDQYLLCINGRSRLGQIEPIAKSVQETGLPPGNYQGGITIGSTTIVFISGFAFYKLFGQIAWLNIPNFQLDAIAPKIWAIAVPKSNANYTRQLVNSLNQAIIINADVNIAGNPAGIVVQDNINQPWLLEFNQTTQTFVARLTKTFDEWTNVSTTANDREYVPIGNQMFMVNQKLFIVRPDKKAVYQSITGRPLDFMLNIDVNGNKLSSEALGGADTTSFAFDSDEITCVRDCITPDSFIYGTARNIRVITLDYANTILGEPRYTKSIAIEAGVVNVESLVYSLGDYLFVDNDGIKSFNAVRNIYVEGNNSIFSLQLAKYFKDMVQMASAAVKFDNYALFYCRTTLGNVILVYDELRQQWSTIDITTVTKIKQFLVLANGLVNQLYAICEDKVWLMYSSEENELCTVFFGALTPTDGKAEHKGQYVKPIFRGGTDTGTVRMIEYVDEQLSDSLMRDLTESVMAVAYPVIPPIIPSSLPNMKSPTFIFKNGLVGKKIAYVLAWNTKAALQAIKTVTSEQDGDPSSRQVGDTNAGPRDAVIVHPPVIVNYTNAEQTFTAICETGFTGIPSTVIIPAGAYTSTISQVYVDQLALAFATEQAIAALTCEPIHGDPPCGFDSSILHNRYKINEYVDGLIANPSGSAPTLTPVVWDGSFKFGWTDGTLYEWYAIDQDAMLADGKQLVMDGKVICNAYLTFECVGEVSTWVLSIWDDNSNIVIWFTFDGDPFPVGLYTNNLSGSQALPATVFVEPDATGTTTILQNASTVCDD